MARRLVSSVLSFALLVSALALDAQRAVAQTFSGKTSVSVTPTLGVGVESVSPQLSNPTALTMSAPTLLAPSVVASPALAQTPKALTPVSAAASVSAKLSAVKPILGVVADVKTGAAGSKSAGHDLEAVLTGGVAASKPELSVAGSESLVPTALAPVSRAASVADAKDSVPSAEAPEPKSTDSLTSYKLRRAFLKYVAAATGAVFTLPQAGAALTAKIVASAADKQAVLSDFDDTLAGYNETLPAEKIAAIKAIKAAGKKFAVISDRTDVKRPNSTQLTVFESLETLPADVRAGMYVAANSGGKVYQYDAQGVPQLVHEAAGLSDAQKKAVEEAAAATKARLSEVGAVQHVADGKNPAESYNTYGYAIMLKPGSSNEQVKGAAAILNEELAKRGFDVEVQARFAKSAENPPYATFSIITKAGAAKYIAGAMGVTAAQALVIGDSMFVPKDAAKASWLTRMGEKLSGRPQVKTGNETDRNMEKGLPGALALGVGTQMDPRVENGWALAGHGPAVTQKVLEAVASKPASSKDDDDGVSKVWGFLGVGAVMLGAAVAYYFMIDAIATVISEGEKLFHGRDWHDGFQLLGMTTLGVVGMTRAAGDDKGMPEATESFARALAKAQAAAGRPVLFVEADLLGDGWSYGFLAPKAEGGSDMVYVRANGEAVVYEGAAAPTTRIPFAMNAYLIKKGTEVSPNGADAAVKSRVAGWGKVLVATLAIKEEAESGDKDLWYTLHDEKGSVASVNGRTGEVRVENVAPKPRTGLTHAVPPAELYALALEQLRTVSEKPARLTSAVHEARYFNGAWVGDEWRFFFAVPGKDGGLQYMVPARRTMVTETMMDAFEPKLVGTVDARSMAESVDAGLFGRAVKIDPDAALAASGVDGVSRVVLVPRTQKNGDKDLWYSFQDLRGDELASVNARTGEVVKAARPAPGSALASFLLWLGGVALVAAVYGGLYWAGSHAPAAAPEPGSWIGPVPSIDQLFGGHQLLGAGLMIGSLGMVGTHAIPDALRVPTEDYAEALKQAADSVKSLGLTAADLRFAGATANSAVSQGRHWSYSFSYEAAGKPGVVYVDVSRQFLGSGMEYRVSRYAVNGVIGTSLRADLFGMAVKVSPDAALALVRKDAPGFGAQASMRLQMRKETVSGDSDLWYTLYDDHGAEVSVNARTGRVEVVKAPDLAALAAAEARAKSVRGWALWIGVSLAAIAAAFAAVAGAR